jgi:hypothetical protein
LDDDQEVARNRLFHRWYLKAGINRFVKLDHTDHDSRIYTSVISKATTPPKKKYEAYSTEPLTNKNCKVNP